MQTITKTILDQLGGCRFTAMTGAKNFTAHPDGLSFRVPSKKANYIKITLKSDDTYKMDFKRIWGYKVIDVKEFDGVYNDQLQKLFTEVTGMDTHL